MKKRHVIAAALLALCIGVALGTFALLPPRPGVTKANFDRIEIGMTEAQLEALLGRKSAQSIDVEKIMRALYRDSKERHFIWTGVYGTAVIRIDEDERVVAPQWQDRGPTLFQRLRSLLPF